VITAWAPPRHLRVRAGVDRSRSLAAAGGKLVRFRLRGRPAGFAVLRGRDFELQESEDFGVGGQEQGGPAVQDLPVRLERTQESVEFRRLPERRGVDPDRLRLPFGSDALRLLVGGRHQTGALGVRLRDQRLGAGTPVA
jgi:hypothetical protein